MTKKRYAPDAPDAKWHRPGDVAYVRELLEAAGLSQRKAGPRIGIAERSMRARAIGEQDLSYTEQYALEVLADRAQGNTMNVVADTVHDAPAERARTQWFNTAERPLQVGDVGKIVVGRDRFGAPIHGTLIRDGFGLVIREAHPQPVDAHNVPIARVDQYTLLDQPEA